MKICWCGTTSVINPPHCSAVKSEDSGHRKSWLRSIFKPGGETGRNTYHTTTTTTTRNTSEPTYSVNQHQQREAASHCDHQRNQRGSFQRISNRCCLQPVRKHHGGVQCFLSFHLDEQKKIMS